MQRILKSYLFWTYPRGSFHYDVMVTLILVFLFVSPRLINYRDRPQETLTATKDIATHGGDWDGAEKWEKATALMTPVFTSQDAQEGARAFAEKRPPVWKGQ